MASTRIKDKRKLQLIQATLDSIATRGINETTITHICKGADLSRGIVNFYFTSKEMLMQESLRHVLQEKDEFWQDAMEAAGDDAIDQLYTVIGAHFSQKLCQKKRLAILSAFWGHAAAHKPYSNLLIESDRELVTKIAELWQNVTGAEAESANNMALRLHALVRGLWLSFMLDPTKETRLSYAEQCERFILEQVELTLARAQQDDAAAAEEAAANKRANPSSQHVDRERPMPTDAANDRKDEKREERAVGDLFSNVGN